MRKWFAFITVGVLGTGLVFAYRPSFASSTERSVLRAVSIELGGSGVCPRFWTFPGQNFGTYGFSNRLAENDELVWLDKAERQARGRDVSLIVGSLIDHPRCLQSVTLQTPRFVGNLAFFVNWGASHNLGVVALRRKGAAWHVLRTKWNSRSPVI